MAREATLLGRYELFVAAATIAAHANWGAKGFRQRDIRFLVELFTNWVEGSLRDGVLPLANTQVMRYVESLVADGHAKTVSRQKQPSYRLTRLGLLELLTRISERPRGERPEHFYFLYYFLRNYRPKLTALIAAEGRQFPTAVRLEIEVLLDYDRLVATEISRIQLELRKLEARISDSAQSSKLATKQLQQGAALEDVVRELERKYPYELNSQKPLHELFADIPADIAHWELTEGNAKRVSELWEPCRKLLRAHLDSLMALSSKG